MKQANWINTECKYVHSSLGSNISKKAYSIIKALRKKSKKKSKTTDTILNKNSKVLSEDKHIIKRWTEYIK